MNLPDPRHAGPRFKLGRIFATPAALEAITDAHVSIVDLLIRHIRGDWGNLPESDRQQNELSVDAGLRLLSSYVLPSGHTIWVITEWDRSSTTFLLPGGLLTCRTAHFPPNSAQPSGCRLAASSFRSVRVPHWTPFAFQSSTS